MRDVVVVTFVVICTLIALRNPVFGMLTFIGMGLFNPHGLTWGFARELPLSAMVAVATMVAYIMWHEPKRVPMTRETVLMAGFWAMMGISTYLAIFPDLANKHFIHVSKIFLMVFLCLSIITTQDRLHMMIRVIALSLGFYGLKGGIFSVLSGGAHIVYGPDDSFLTANNSIGLALAMNVPLLLYLLRIEKNRYLLWLIKAMVVFSYPAVACTYSRGAWLGLGAVTLLYILRSQYKVTLPIVLCLVAALSLPFIPQKLVDRFHQLENYQDEGSAQSRFWNWEMCRRVGMGNPTHGGGFDYYSEQAYATYYPEFLEQWPGKVWSCHSMWFTVLGEHGIPGFLLWVALLGFTIMESWQLLRLSARDPQWKWIGDYASMVQGALLAFMISGTFLDVAYFDLYYELIAVIVILRDLVRRAEIQAKAHSGFAGSIRPAA